MASTSGETCKWLVCLLAMIAGLACSADASMAAAPRDGGSQPEPPLASAGASSDVACEAMSPTDVPSVTVTTSGTERGPWLAVGRDVNAQQDAIVTSIDEQRLSLMLMPTSRMLDVEGLDTESLSITVGDSVWIHAQSGGGGNYQAGAVMLIVRASLDGPVLFATYTGDQRLLGGAFSTALGIEIGVEDGCSYVPEFTCFDGQRTTFLQLTLSAADRLSLASGGVGELSIGGDGYEVVVASAVRVDDGPSTRCFDAIFGPAFQLALTRR